MSNSLHDILKDIYEAKIKEQLEVIILQRPGYTPDPNLHSLSSKLISTVGEFKKYLEDNSIPDSAEFSDTGYEIDGSYYFSWRDDGKEAE